MTAILCLNVGSASLKFSGWVREGRSLHRAFRGGQDIARGTDRAAIHAEDGERLDDLTTDEAGRAGGPDVWNGLVRALLARAGDLLGDDIVVGHRVVHGGEGVEPVRIDAPCWTRAPIFRRSRPATSR